jgi:hypothetical protein
MLQAKIGVFSLLCPQISEKNLNRYFKYRWRYFLNT